MQVLIEKGKKPVKYKIEKLGDSQLGQEEDDEENKGKPQIPFTYLF